MYKAVLWLVTGVLLSGCFFAPKPIAPTADQVSDACVLLDEHRGWRKALKRAVRDRKWRKSGIKAWHVMAIIYHESHFKQKATPKKVRWRAKRDSRKVPSPFGYAQAKLATWNDYITATGRYGAQRESFADAAHFVAWYMHESTIRVGIESNDITAHYLAYHEGWGGYSRRTWKKKERLVEKARHSLPRISERYRAQLMRCGF